MVVRAPTSLYPYGTISPYISLFKVTVSWSFVLFVEFMFINVLVFASYPYTFRFCFVPYVFFHELITALLFPCSLANLISCKWFDGLLRSPYIISKMCIPIVHVLDPSPTSNHSGTRLSVVGSINGIYRRYSWISLYCKHCTARVAPMTVRLRQAMKAVMVNMPSGRFPQDMVVIEPTLLLFKSRLFLPNNTSI